MADTGIFFRRATKENLLLEPPAAGEIVFAIDTEEFGSFVNGQVQWEKLFTQNSVSSFSALQTITGYEDLVYHVADINKLYIFSSGAWKAISEISDLEISAQKTWSSSKISSVTIDGGTF